MPKNNEKFKIKFRGTRGSYPVAKKNFLELYNALSGSQYELNDTELERKTIDQTLYNTFNNDVSWVIDGKLIVLVEHQSTVNENMPFRCLEYVTRIYEEIVPVNTRYEEKVRKIPNPDFYVVYVGKKTLPLEQELCLSDAFYNKENSKLELVVKVKNCTDPKLLPIVGKCDILKQYCQFVEIVESTYNKRDPKRSFKKAIEKAISKGILSDYLNRKSRAVINMLCAKYDYKADIAVKKREAFEDGRQAKAEEIAINCLKEGDTPEKVSRCSGLPHEKVLELQEQITVKA